MSIWNQHIIQQQIFEVSYSAYDRYQRQHQDLDRLFQTIALHEMGKLFDDLTPPDLYIRLDRVEVDLGSLRVEYLQEDLIKQLKKQLDLVLRQKLQETETSSAKPTNSTTSGAISEAFLHFLEQGFLPWWCEHMSFAQLEEQLSIYLAKEVEQGQQLLRHICAHPPLLSRLIYQSSNEFLGALLSWGNYESIYQILYKIEKLKALSPRNLRQVLWRAVFEASPLNAAKLASSLTEKLCKETAIPPAVLLHNLVDFFSQFSDLTRKEETILPSPDLYQLVEEWKKLAVLNNMQQEALINGQHNQPEISNLEHLSRIDHEAASAQTDQGVSTTSDDTPTSNVAEESTLPSNFKNEVEIKNSSRQFEEQQLPSFPSIGEKEPSKATTVQSSLTEDPIYLVNSGLVLLHPFLPELFKTLDWTEDHKFIKEDHQESAVHLLAWLATGSESVPEHDLVLSKVLCNMPLDRPVELLAKLTQKEKIAGLELLEAVIQHWQALGNTSIEALQQAFLQRKGKLNKVDHGWQLQVEKKTIDILLDRLPWGFSTIRLPWMNQLLHVQWIN